VNEEREASGRRSPASGEHAHRRRWVVPATLLGGIAGLAVLAWLSVPAWLPALVAGQLPEGWRLDTLSVERPGPKRTLVEQARVMTTLAGLELTIGIEDGAMTYDGPKFDVRRLTIDARRIPADPSDRQMEGEWSPDDLALPRLPPPGELPATRIGEVVLSWDSGTPGMAPRRWRFTDIDLDPEAERVLLDARLDSPNGFGAPLDFLLDLGAASLELTVRREGGDAPVLRLSQASDPGRGDTRAEAFLDIDLGWLDTTLLAPFTRALGLDPLDEAAGRIRAITALRGAEKLRPEQVAVSADALRLRSGDASIEGKLDLAAARKGDQLELRAEQFALTLGGPLPGVDELLRPLIEPLGLGALLQATDRSLGLRLPSRTELTLGMVAPYPLRLSTDASLDARFEGSESVLTLSGLVLTVPDLDRPGNAALDTGFDLRGRLDRAVLVRTGEQAVGTTSATFELAGTLARASEGGLHVEGEIQNLDLGDFSVSHPAATLRLGALTVGGPFAIDDGELSWSGPVSGTGLVVAPVDAIATTNLLTASALSFDLEVAGADTLVVGGAGRLDGVLLPDLGITLDGVAVTIDALTLPAVDGRLGFVTTGLEAQLGEDRYTGIDLDLGGALTGGSRFDGDGELLIGFTGSLPFAFNADLDAASVRATLDQAPLPASALRDGARALALSVPKALTFTEGRLVLDGEVRLGEAGLAGDLDVRGEALGLALGESRLEGLDFETRVALEDVISGNGPLTLRLAQLAAGLDLVELDTAVTFSGVDFGLLELDAGLLGGHLSSPGLRLSGGELMDTLIRWEGFDLARLLAFVDVSGLEGSGTLDAEIPLVSEDGGPAVRDGWFRARGPGVLRYGTGVPATNIGLQALENFQYDTLEGTLAYGADGAYTITVDLLGRNPDLYGGHPVRFRLNLGGAMPALFRSLFVTGNFEEAIIERLRAGESPLEETP
jgi:hypothetical protein